MSVAINQYVIYGYFLKYDQMQELLIEKCGGKEGYEEFCDTYHDNGYKKELTCHDGLNLIMDGISGTYAVFGIVLERTRDCEHINNFKFGKIPLKTRKILEGNVINQWFQEKGYNAELQLLTHYH